MREGLEQKNCQQQQQHKQKGRETIGPTAGNIRTKKKHSVVLLVGRNLHGHGTHRWSPRRPPPPDRSPSPGPARARSSSPACTSAWAGACRSGEPASSWVFGSVFGWAKPAFWWVFWWVFWSASGWVFGWAASWAGRVAGWVVSAASAWAAGRASGWVSAWVVSAAAGSVAGWERRRIPGGERPQRPGCTRCRPPRRYR